MDLNTATNLDSKTNLENKIQVDALQKSGKKPESIDTKLANKEDSFKRGGDLEIKSSQPVKLDKQLIPAEDKANSMITKTPDNTQYKSLLITNEGNKSSTEDIDSKKENNKMAKFKSEAPIKGLIKYDTNSSAINLLSPHNDEQFNTGKRKYGGNYGSQVLHPDGTSIVSANLSSEKGTA